MNYVELEKKLKCAVDLNRRVVGVKFIFTKDDFIKTDVPRVRYKTSYCSMVKLATMGKRLKANFDNSLCSGATRALGLEEMDGMCDSGYRYYYLDMYNSMCVAKKVHKEANLISQRIYGVVTQPLEYFSKDPDVVILVVNPYQCMRVMQGYSYSYGLCNNIKFAGNQAVCLECTTRPYETNDLNVSVFCSNTRFTAKWKKTEMAMGMPFNKFPTVIDGVINTINGTERDESKREILKRAEKLKVDFSNITFGSSYY